MIKYKVIGLIAFLAVSPFFVYGQSRTIQAWHAKADTLVAHEAFEEAAAVYTKLINKTALRSPDDFAFLYARASCYYNTGNQDAALQDINQYLERFPGGQALALRAYIYEAQGNTDAMLADIHALVKSMPDNDDLLRWQLSALLEAERYAAAAGALEQYLTQHPGQQDMQLYLGMSYFLSGEQDNAFTIFEQVMANDPMNLEVYQFTASLLLDEGHEQQALAYINSGLQHFPDDATLLFYKGAARVEQPGGIEEGCRCLAKAFAHGMDDAADYLKEYCYGVE